MSDDDVTPDEPSADAVEGPFEETPAEAAARVEAFDLDHDGKVSFVEGARAQLGVVDAHLEEVGKEGGLKGKTAEIAHHLLDKLDND